MTMTTLAQERRIRKRQKESFSQSLVEFQPHPGGLYDDDDEEEEEEERMNSQQRGAASSSSASDGAHRSSSNNNRNKKEGSFSSQLSREQLEERYNRDEAQKARSKRPNTRPTLAKLQVAVVKSEYGLAAVPEACTRAVRDFSRRSMWTTTKSSSSKLSSAPGTTVPSVATARQFLQRALSAYRDCASDWVPGWSGDEACHSVSLFKQEEGATARPLKALLTEQRHAARNTYLNRMLGTETAQRLLQQLDDEAAAAAEAEQGADDDLDILPSNSRGGGGRDVLDNDEERELAMNDAEDDANVDNDNNSPETEPPQTNASHGNESTVAQEQPSRGPAHNKRRRHVLLDDDDDEDVEDKAQTEPWSNDSAVTSDRLQATQDGVAAQNTSNHKRRRRTIQEEDEDEEEREFEFMEQEDPPADTKDQPIDEAAIAPSSGLRIESFLPEGRTRENTTTGESQPSSSSSDGCCPQDDAVPAETTTTVDTIPTTTTVTPMHNHKDPNANLPAKALETPETLAGVLDHRTQTSSPVSLNSAGRSHLDEEEFPLAQPSQFSLPEDHATRNDKEQAKNDMDDASETPKFLPSQQLQPELPYTQTTTTNLDRYEESRDDASETPMLVPTLQLTMPSQTSEKEDNDGDDASETPTLLPTQQSLSEPTHAAPLNVEGTELDDSSSSEAPTRMTSHVPIQLLEEEDIIFEGINNNKPID